MLLDSGFGHANGWDPTTSSWLNVRHGPGTTIDRFGGYLVRPDTAKEYVVISPTIVDAPSDGHSVPSAPAGPAKITNYKARFNVSADSFTRLSSDIALEVLPHLVSSPGANVQVVIEIIAEAPAGFTEKAVKTVAQNAAALKSDDSKFGS
jgi:hypothetical protein